MEGSNLAAGGDSAAVSGEEVDAAAGGDTTAGEAGVRGVVEAEVEVETASAAGGNRANHTRIIVAGLDICMDPQRIEIAIVTVEREEVTLVVTIGAGVAAQVVTEDAVVETTTEGAIVALVATAVVQTGAGAVAVIAAVARVAAANVARSIEEMIGTAVATTGTAGTESTATTTIAGTVSGTTTGITGGSTETTLTGRMAMGGGEVAGTARGGVDKGVIAMSAKVVIQTGAGT